MIWTDEQVTRIQRWQECSWMHGYTCPTHGNILLTVTPDGFKCSQCGYTQTHVMEMVLANEPPENPIERSK